MNKTTFTNYELSSIARGIAETITRNGDYITETSIVNYVSENFFTFSESEKMQIVNYTIDEYIALPFC